MLKKLFIFLSFCWFVQASIIPDPGADLYPGIHKVDNELYWAPMAKHPGLFLVMERVTRRNLDLWCQYARIQHQFAEKDSRKTTRKNEAGQVLPPLPPLAGIHHFELVLEDSKSDKISLNHNEVWVAYITSDEAPQHIPDYMKNYSNGKGFPFAQSIKMFVTIASSKEALLTSHMGISYSVESTFQKRPPQISMDLHSFGAQVMRRRNPERRFMMNAPVFGMARILIKALPPRSVFVGTIEMRKHMLEGISISFDEFRKKDLNSEKDEFDFKMFRNPYLSPLSEKGDSEEFLGLMKDHPPLLSFGDGDGVAIKDHVTIYKPGEDHSVWMSIEKGNPSYEWLFTEPFQAAQRTYFVLTRLDALADAVPVA